MSHQDSVAGNAQPAESPVKSSPVANGASAEPELAMNYCPRCSTRLAARSCKLICPGCGYYMSCSDFY
jgi:hypothetical protein